MRLLFFYFVRNVYLEQKGRREAATLYSTPQQNVPYTIFLSFQDHHNLHHIGL
ncbi:hypothetical protein BGLY_1924 [Bacillus glycinifermentans]|nr:hypothetical protein BGLY_1924 [Bacillus glycinifermentans]